MSIIASVLWLFYFGLVIVILAVIGLSIWMLKEYFQLKGHYDPSEELIGQVGTVKKDCTAHQRGKVYVAGAYWDAISAIGALHQGEDIQVVEVRDKFLVVNRVDLIQKKNSQEI